ncbi:MAG: hypothetical protein ABL952_16495, partial [Pyrinomonadaceae bacterium]
MSKAMKRLITLIFLALATSAIAAAQTTQFGYQGSLVNAGSPASGSHDFEFALFDAQSGGAQLGTTNTLNNVFVNAGIFNVTLNFGSQFPGADRFLEIRVRPSGGGGFTTLIPRQKLTSGPYAIKSLTSDTATNATQLGGVAANLYVVTTDPRMTDAREPTAGSNSYIQNQSASSQASSNFRISGTGRANIISADSGYGLAGISIINMRGTDVTFGPSAGLNQLGSENLFVGRGAGVGELPASGNTGSGNSVVGVFTGQRLNTGSFNSLFGIRAGDSVRTGSNNTIIGADADATNGLSYATAIGSEAVADVSNSVFLGRSSGADAVRIPGTLYTGDNVVVGQSTVPPGLGANNLYVTNDGGDPNNSFRLDGSANNLFIVARSGSGATAGAGIVFRTSLGQSGETTR